MISSIISSDTIVNKCLKFIESYFPIKFTRKSYDNEKLKLFFKLSWISGQPISVALVVMRKDYWHITHIVTREGFRFEGYGRKLLKRILREAKRNKVSYISCNIREGNEASVKFFESFRFGRSTPYKLKPGFNYYKLKLN
jgi:ribosomal protein S18 acetylase RimI-like enzyme